MESRSWVISHVLRLEQVSSDALREILRIYDHPSRTLGNQSKYALSFKTKIDLLYDLGEIDKPMYSHLIKLMEIRNQFAHNPTTISFASLDNIDDRINKYLLNVKNCPKEIGKEQDKEKKLKLIFEHIYGMAIETLLVIVAEYSNAIKKEIQKHMNDTIIRNLDSVWKKAYEKNCKKMKTIPGIALLINKQTELDYFFDDLKSAMNEVMLEEIRKTKPTLTTILKQKVNTVDILKTFKTKGTE